MSNQISFPRLASLDLFRGLTIVAMVLANFLAGPALVPAWLKHAKDVGLTVIDLIAPFFIFAVALTYRASFLRRAARYGLTNAYAQFVQRYLALIGVGTILSAGEDWVGLLTVTHRWGVLEAIGVAGLIALLAVRLPLPWLFAAGLGLLAAYQYLLDHFWLSIVLDSSHGGFEGALSWSAMLILAIALVELFNNPRLREQIFPLAAALTLGLGCALSWLIPISKNRVSAPYVLVSLGIGALLFFICHIFCERLGRRISLLETWGQNPLALYLLHLLLLGVFALVPIPGWYEQAPPWLILLQGVFLIASLTAIAGFLKQRGWFLKL